MTKLIDTITLPQGLRSLSGEQLSQVAEELRQELIDTVAESGGHFASSLGATEISVALHHVFDTPADRIVWDVGHQGYIHKMLTGRRGRMSSIRKKDGLSGFLSRTESEYDAFGAGHAGTSISAALGMCAALAREQSKNKVVAVIGDGSITAGMAFEALNHAGNLGHNLIVLLNDNEMSISPNVGAISWLFSRAITSRYPTLARQTFKDLHKRGYVPEFIYRTIDRAEEATQGFFASPSMLFEAFGFRYIGPVNGNNVSDLVTALQHARQQDVPVLVHAHTTKGKGYTPAEEDPIKWHGVTPFDRSAAKFIAAPQGKKIPSYTQVFSDTIIELANNNPKIIGITAAMASGTGLDKFEQAHPDKFYDVAICEQHAVTFAAGMACEGYRPVCAIYSTFLQRAFDQVVHDVCIQNLPVVFAMDRGGVVGNDGHTHQGVFDISYLRCLPNLVLMSPKDEGEFRQMLFTAIQHNGPIALRYPRGNGIGVDLSAELKTLEIGKSEIVRSGSDAVIVAFGPMVQNALEAADYLMQSDGISVTVINARFAKPLDEELLAEQLPRYPLVCSIEDHALMGGFGSALIEFVNDHGIQLKSSIKRFGISDAFVPHANQSEQQQLLGYDPRSIAAYIRSHSRTQAKAVNA